MHVEPEYPAFARTYAEATPQVLWTTLVADLETPVSAMLKLADGRPNSFLFESVEGGAIRGRYSFIGRDPDLIWRCRGDRAEIDRAGPHRRRQRSSPARCRPRRARSPRCARSSTRIAASSLPEGLPPMSAGLFGYIGYDMVRLMERLPDANPDRARPARRDVPAADGDRRLRQDRGHADHRHAGTDPSRGSSPRTPSPKRASRLADAIGDSRPQRFRRRRGAVPPARAPSEPLLQPVARRVSRDRRAGEGVHRRRRHLPGGAVAALPRAVHLAAVRAVPGAAPAEPVAVPVLPRLRRASPSSAPARRSWCECATAR